MNLVQRQMLSMVVNHRKTIGARTSHLLYMSTLCLCNLYNPFIMMWSRRENLISPFSLKRNDFFCSLSLLLSYSFGNNINQTMQRTDTFDYNIRMNDMPCSAVAFARPALTGDNDDELYYEHTLMALPVAGRALRYRFHYAAANMLTPRLNTMWTRCTSHCIRISSAKGIHHKRRRVHYKKRYLIYDTLNMIALFVTIICWVWTARHGWWCNLIYWVPAGQVSMFVRLLLGHISSTLLSS